MKRNWICECVATGLLVVSPVFADCSESSQVVTEYYVPAHESHHARSSRHPGYVSYGMSEAATYSRCCDEGQRVREVSEFSFRGPIDSIRTIETGLDGDQVTIATIDDADQGLSTVNLGPQRQLASLNLRTSDRITVRGMNDRRDASGRLIASRLEFNDRTIVLNRDLGTDSVAIDDTREMNGEIVSTRTEMLGSTRHVILKLRGEDDRIDVIDLGPERNLRELNLKEGQRITLRAHQGRYDGRTRLFASRLEVNDRTIDIDRDDNQPRLQGQPVSPDDRDRSEVKENSKMERSDTDQDSSDELKPEQSAPRSSGNNKSNSEYHSEDK